MSRPTAELVVEPLTPDRWPDLVELFGPNGASSGCWCMWWRLSARAWEDAAGAGNRRALATIVAEDQQPGLLAYAGDTPVGWCSVAPRTEFPRLDRSPKLKPVDDAPVWSVVCFYIAPRARATGVATALLEGAVELARSGGARIIEGYPVDPGDGAATNAAAFTGVLELYRRAGFTEVLRRGGRPIVRRVLDHD